MSLYECALKEQKYLDKLKPNLNTRLFTTIPTRLDFIENNIINLKYSVLDRILLDYSKIYLANDLDLNPRRGLVNF